MSISEKQIEIILSLADKYKFYNRSSLSVDGAVSLKDQKNICELLEHATQSDFDNPNYGDSLSKLKKIMQYTQESWGT